jgi:hypothetical protein
MASVATALTREAIGPRPAISSSTTSLGLTPGAVPRTTTSGRESADVVGSSGGALRRMAS